MKRAVLLKSGKWCWCVDLALLTALEHAVMELDDPDLLKRWRAL